VRCRCSQMSSRRGRRGRLGKVDNDMPSGARYAYRKMHRMHARPTICCRRQRPCPCCSSKLATTCVLQVPPPVYANSLCITTLPGTRVDGVCAILSPSPGSGPVPPEVLRYFLYRTGSFAPITGCRARAPPSVSIRGPRTASSRGPHPCLALCTSTLDNCHLESSA
jgi:hypothetical protein